MKSGTAAYAELKGLLAPSGLIPRGGFFPEPADGVPALSGGRSAATVIMVGNAGPDMWRAFASAGLDGRPDPLNRWSKSIIDDAAARLGGEAVYPFGGPPYLPFQRWAQRAEAVYPSPIGPLIHPTYGLWHAYRGAVVLAEVVDLPPWAGLVSPCETCADRPCLSTCPVGAFRPDGYDVPGCVGHIDSSAGRDCLDGGCLARRACPIGRQYHYAPEQMNFHMDAFRRANR